MFLKLRHLAIALALALICTAAVAAENFTFVHVSDTHITGTERPVRNLTAAAEEINAMNPKPAFVIISGDQTEAGLPSQWKRYKEVISHFTVPIYGVAGNHETKWSEWGKLGQHKFLDQEPYYSFTHGGIHFVAMDSTIWLQHHGQIDKAELAWLKKDLDKAGRDTPSVLFYHHCPGFIPNQGELLRTIRPYNVRLILVGHGHTFHTWKRNGLLFQEVKGSMNDNGGYRILEVSNNEIRSFTKLVGEAPVLDATISLVRTVNPITITQPQFDQLVEGKLSIKASVKDAVGRSVEYSVDDATGSMTSDGHGIYTATIDFSGDPGRHTVSVTAKDTDGMEWSDSVPVRINGASREVWRAQVSGGVERGVHISGNKVYFGTLGGDVYCLDARTGRQIWRHSSGSDVICEVAVDGNLACFGTTDGRVIGLNAKTGKIKWQYKTGGPISASPIIADGKVLIGSGECAFYALDAASGAFSWKFPMSRHVQVLPVQLDGAVMFGAWDKNFYSLDIKTGKPRWTTPIGISWYFSASNSDPVTDGKHIVVNVTPYKAVDPDIYCLDSRTGQVVWNIRHPKSDCGFNSPCLVGDRCYSVSMNGNVYCNRVADGTDIWQAKTGVSVMSAKPAFADGKLYLTGLHGKVVCLNTATSNIDWTYSTGDEGYLFGGEAIWKDLVIVPSTDGTVTAIKR